MINHPISNQTNIKYYAKKINWEKIKTIIAVEPIYGNIKMYISTNNCLNINYLKKFQEFVSWSPTKNLNQEKTIEVKN